MDNDKIPNFLAEQRDQAPDDLQHYFLTFEDYWERKLWHELTDLLTQFYQEDQSAPQRIPIYNTFIKSFADKINQLKLVGLGLRAALQFPTDQEALTFLTNLSDSVNKPSSQDAHVYALSAMATVHLRMGQTAAARSTLDVCEAKIDTFDNVEEKVHAAFYKASADYYHAMHDFAPFYRNTLLHLACIDISHLPEAHRARTAHDLAVAALVSDSIYNFGELLLHPILDSLIGGPNAWLRDLLLAFNRGDLAAYDVLAANMDKNPLLKEHATFLYQKISLAALTELVFRRPPHDRAMTFSTIATETKVRPDEIEHLIMKALSLGLLRGQIDQVAQIAKVSWVQPKVLDREQIVSMRDRLQEWDRGVNRLGNWIEGVGKDVWAA